MTRPTEKQLAEALREADELIGAMLTNNADSRDIGRKRLKIEKMLRAYRSAQQAEAGAAGDLREQFAKASEAAGYGRPEMGPWSSDQFMWERDQDRFVGWQLGRQQGMAQANREVVIHGDRWLITPLPAGDVEVRWLGEYLTEGKRLTPRSQPVRRVEQDQPAASSAREPVDGELLPCPFCGAHLPTFSKNIGGDSRHHMIRCTECPGRAHFMSSTEAQAVEAWNRRAAPARLAGAAQGEAEQ